MQKNTKKPDRLWTRFVWLSLSCALLPGFGLAALMTGAWAAGWPRGAWHAASIQVHAVSLLMGWGGAMILGVGLHFLPRLRGVRLRGARWAAVLFWALVAGLILRMTGQLALGGLVPAGETSRLLLNGAVVGGAALQTISVTGLLVILITTFRSGRPLKENKGFQQIAPLLAVAALALFLAQLAWCLGAFRGWTHGASDLAVLPVAPQRGAVDLMLFGFVMAMAAGMSARLFPLTFRTRPASPHGLKMTAALLAAGAGFTVLEATQFPGPPLTWNGLAAAFYGCGILTGTFSVRIFHRRKAIPHAPTAYRMREDPAAIGVASAYFWAVMAALLLFALALARAGAPLPAQAAQENLARHAMGAGFMTLLIISVGWKMLPGFGGCLPQGRGRLWCAVTLGNAAALLRMASLLAGGDGGSPRSWAAILPPVAGAIGMAAILAFMLALRASFRGRQNAMDG